MPQTSTSRQEIPNSTHRLAAGAVPVAVADADTKVTVSLRLRRNRLVRPVRPPTSTGPGIPVKSRRYLSRKEFRAQYGAASVDIEKIAAFARTHGLTLVESDAGRRTVVLAGTVAQMNAAFAVELRTFHTGTVSYMSHAGPASVPTELAVIVESIHGLDTRPLAQPLFRQAAAPQAASALLPAQVGSLYHCPTNSAAGYTVGILEFGGGYRPSDIQQYFQTVANLPAPNVSFVGIDGATNSPGVDSDADTEVILDIAVAGSLAPGAKIVIYFAPNNDQGWHDAVTTAIADTENNPSALSISWGGAENIWGNYINTMSQAFAEAQLVGVPIFASSGDSGSEGGLVNYPASDPGVTGCGGTTISDISGASFTQTGWGGSGGGVSAVFPLPTWQQGLHVTLASGGTAPLTMRGVPDIAGDGDPASGYQLILNGQSIGPVGGTSAVAPFYAGLSAVLSATLDAPVGYLNPDLYQFDGPSLEDDVTIGSNGEYDCSSGWDAVTGLGSIWGSGLLSVLAPVPAGSWHMDDITAQTNATLAAGDPRGYMFDAQGTQHIVYRGTDGHIHELYWNGNWNTDDITAQANATPAAGNPCGYVFNAQGTQHVDYRGTDGHIHELYWNGTWNTNDLTADTNATPAAGDPCGYTFDAQGTQHVDYRGTDGHIHELYWNGTWNTNDLTADTNATLAAGDPCGYVFVAQGTQHVDYRGTDGHIHELYWNGTWNTNDLTADTNATPAAGDPCGYVFDAQGTQHVDYCGTDGHIHELYWNGQWWTNDLTADTNATPAEGGGDPCGYMFDAQGTQHVDYCGVDGHIHELYWNGQWYTNDLTQVTNAPPAGGNPTGYVFIAQGTQHVIYRGTNGHIYELWWG
jgi:hypothetical protein